MAKQERTAITPRRDEDFSEWYQQVIKGADLAEHSPVRGCMIIRPWGYGIWEEIQSALDRMIKKTGHENVYFPQFIPLSSLEKEADHIEGFAKECAVVTHHRLEAKDGKLIPASPLEEPLIVRPTSETVIGQAFSRWIQSYRDLPVKINQWANVVRWEMRTRLFLRTSEFLWQEGHTAHASAEEAQEEARTMLGVYETLLKDYLAVPAIAGRKSAGEKFPGADDTYCLEAMMQDRKALQATTSHYFGQNFAKAFEIQFSDESGELKHPHTTSWGATTRLVGAVIMTHSDDDGLRLPPKIAPKHLVIIPFLMKEEEQEKILNYAKEVQQALSNLYHGKREIIVHLDERDMRSGEKNWDWVRKGIPLRLELGGREADSATVTLKRRDRSPKEKETLSLEELKKRLPGILDEMQANYLKQATDKLQEHTYDHIDSFDALETFFTPKNKDKPEAHAGFVKAKWCGNSACEEKVQGIKVTIRCLPFEQTQEEGCCLMCGKKAINDVILAKSY